MATTPTKESPPPLIGKVGRYTVFLTPPTTKAATETSPKENEIPSESPKFPPPVQPPPIQFNKSYSGSSSSVFGFFWDTIAKVQNVHSNLDEYLADWFGLNQSKYQWALNDYYESKGMEKPASKPKEVANKAPSV